ncbi:MAG: hypothetical protein SGILL_009543, partial [Bacillariaceae sp.]
MVHSLAWSPSGQSLAAGLGDGTVAIFSVQDNNQLVQTGLLSEGAHESSVVSVVYPNFSNNSNNNRLAEKILCSAGSDASILFWDLGSCSGFLREWSDGAHQSEEDQGMDEVTNLFATSLCIDSADRMEVESPLFAQPPSLLFGIPHGQKMNWVTQATSFGGWGLEVRRSRPCCVRTALMQSTSSSSDEEEKKHRRKGKAPSESKRPSLWEEIGGVLPEQPEEEFPRFTRMKWKKKTYVMMQDVRNKLKRDRARSPKKAEEVVARMQLWYDHQKSLHKEEKMQNEGNVLGEDEDPLLSFMETTMVQAYNLWVHTFARSGLESAGYLAEDVMMDMQQHDIPPDVVTYTSILDAHARSAGKGGGARAAEDFLRRLLENGADEGSLNTLTFDTILNAWALEGTFESAEHAEMILYGMEDKPHGDFKPTATSYTTVINAYAKVGSSKAAEKSEALLNRMIRRAEEEMVEINAGRRSKKSKQRVVRPDTIIFNSCLNTWATARDPRAGKKSMDLLKKMKELSAVDPDPYDTEPDIISYNTVLSCWSHSGDQYAALQAEKIVKEMRKMSQASTKNKGEMDDAVQANNVTFNTVLHAWSQSQLKNSASRAEALFEYMVQSEDPAIAPD